MSNYQGLTAGGHASQHNGDIYHTNNYHGHNQLSPEERERLNMNLVKAAKEGQFQRVRYLLRAGADVDYVDVNQEGGTALGWATLNQRKEVVDVLIAAGADVNDRNGKSGNPAIYLAAMGSSKEIVEALIRAGADIDGGLRFSALMEAVLRGQNGVVEVLLAAGASATRTNFPGFNALHLAALSGNLHAAKMLLAAGVDPDAQNSRGDTALHFVARKNHMALARMLCDAGARTDIKNVNGDDPVDTARGKGYVDVFNYLNSAERVSSA